jgi:anti-sigma factor RsiW
MNDVEIPATVRLFPPSGRCCSDLRLDRYLVDELAPTDRAELEEHLAEAPACRARLDELRADRDACTLRPLVLSAAPSVSPVSPSSSSSSSSSPSSSRWSGGRVLRLVTGPALAAAAVLVVMLRPAAGPGDVDVIRTKGSGVRLGVVAKEGEAAPRIVEDGRVAVGATLRFQVTLDAPAHVGVVAVDAAGSVSAFAPDRGALVDVGAGETALPFATALDPTPGTERLQLFACATSRDVDALVQAVRAGTAPTDCRVDVVVLAVGEVGAGR